MKPYIKQLLGQLSKLSIDHAMYKKALGKFIKLFIHQAMYKKLVRHLIQLFCSFIDGRDDECVIIAALFLNVD